MKRNAIAVLAAICTVVLGAGGGRALAGDKPIDPSSIEFRSQFIESFKHIPYDSTAADAMFLRILVDEAHRKHNVDLTGQIALQLHSGDKLLIEFKDIYIRPLK